MSSLGFFAHPPKKVHSKGKIHSNGLFEAIF